MKYTFGAIIGLSCFAPSIAREIGAGERWSSPSYFKLRHYPSLRPQPRVWRGEIQIGDTDRRIRTDLAQRNTDWRYRSPDKNGFNGAKYRLAIQIRLFFGGGRVVAHFFLSGARPLAEKNSV